MSLAHTLTLTSIAVGMLLGVIGFLENRRAQRKSHTIQLVSSFMLNSCLSESDFRMTRLINACEKLDGQTIDDETDKFVINLLDYYEFLASGYAEGGLDQNAILQLRGGPMDRAFTVCEQYIQDRRESLGAPNLYRNYERLVAEYRRRDPGL